MAGEQPRTSGWRRLATFVNIVGARIRSLFVEVEMIAPDVAALEAEIAALVDEVPELADVFEFAREENPWMLPDLVEFAREVIEEERGREEAEKGRNLDDVYKPPPGAKALQG